EEGAGRNLRPKLAQYEKSATPGICAAVHILPFICGIMVRRAGEHPHRANTASAGEMEEEDIAGIETMDRAFLLSTTRERFHAQIIVPRGDHDEVPAVRHLSAIATDEEALRDL